MIFIAAAIAFVLGFFAGAITIAIVTAAHEEEPESKTKITIRPDGVHELALHRFREKEKIENATVEILECEDCGEVSIGWRRND